jgi:hypothetical protein
LRTRVLGDESLLRDTKVRHADVAIVGQEKILGLAGSESGEQKKKKKKK